MARHPKQLDANWRQWLKENLERQCDSRQLRDILLRNGFSASAIDHAMTSVAADSLASGRVISTDWKRWLQENIERGCDPEVLLDTLLLQGFSEDSIAQAIREIAAQPREQFCNYEAIANPPLLRRLDGRELRKVETDRLQLYLLDDFLSCEECEDIAAIANQHLRPSTVTIAGEDKNYRTSRTCDLSLLNHPMVAALDAKISATVGIRPEYSEGIQAQRYDVGEQFKQHTDYFEPNTTEYAQHAAERGNRTWTFMVYLNDGMEGGGTRFFAIEQAFQPKLGQAVIWNNLTKQGVPNQHTLHSGEPVLSGYKLIITKWFREKGSGPMFYSAADLSEISVR